MEKYRIIYEGGQGEIVEKKSRFICHIFHVTSQEEAEAILEKMRKKYWDATHNCYAYCIGKKQELMRCSDDGEPSGTAGRPILDVLLREQIHDAVIVVTRYFGGVLLGTGGLVRAYQKAASEGLAAAEILSWQEGRPLAVETDYQGYGKVEYLFRELGVYVEDTDFGQQVTIRAMVPGELIRKTEKEIGEKTGGKARLSWDDDIFYALDEKRGIILKKRGIILKKST